MEKMLRFFVGLLLLLSLSGNALAADVNLPPAVAKAIESRVLILIYSAAENTENELIAFGSGFVVKPGYAATTAHHFLKGVFPFVNPSFDEIVIKVGVSIFAELTKAEIVNFDLFNDLALLKIEQPEKVGPPVMFADAFPDDGETVYASGFGFDGSFKTTFQAIILGKMDAIAYDGWLINYVALIDRMLPRGFSGGPVFNKKGELAGMNLCATTEGISGILTLWPIRYFSLKMK